MMKRGLLIALSMASVNARATQPAYVIRHQTYLERFSFQHQSIGSFTPSGRITVNSYSSSFYLYENDTLRNLTTYWNHDVGSIVYTNDRRTFANSDVTSYARFKPNIDAPWQWLHSIGDYAENVYANGMTNDFIFGAQIVNPSNTFAEPWTYNTVTGQYRAFSTVPYGFPGGEIQDMNEQGDALVVMAHDIWSTTFQESRTAFIFRDGVKKASLGKMVRGVMNSKGQVVGEIATAYDDMLFKYWDGAAMHDVNNLAWGVRFTPQGLSDDTTILMSRSSADSYNVLYKDGSYFRFEDVCPGLPTGMKIYGAKIRGDGAIAGVGILNNETYLMRFDPVPEPATLAIFGMGLAAIMCRRRRSHL